MPPPEATLADLFDQLPALFPAASPLILSPSAGSFAPHAERYSGGHAARWFAATDGQQGQRPLADAHVLCSLAEALEVAKIADQLRSEPDGYWVEPHWLAIASDGAGQHFMIDDRDGRVLAVAHDDDHVEEIASSPEAWLKSLLDGRATGSIVWDEVFGLVAAKKLEEVREAHRAQSARTQQGATIPTKHKIGLALTVSLSVVLSLLFAWYLETHR